MAREFGIPCVVDVEHATSVLKSGKVGFFPTITTVYFSYGACIQAPHSSVTVYLKKIENEMLISALSQTLKQKH